MCLTASCKLPVLSSDHVWLSLLVTFPHRQGGLGIGAPAQPSESLSKEQQPSIPTQSQLALVAESNQALSRWSIQGSSAYILLLDITTLVAPCINSVLIYLVQAFRSSAMMSS